MKTKISTSLVVAVAAILVATTGHGATLASFAFDTNISSLTSSTTPANATVSVFGNGPNTENATFEFASRFGVNRAYVAAQDGVYTSADNLADGEFMTFTVQANSGFKLNLSNLAFRAARNGGGGTINLLDLYVSVDNGAFSKVGDTLSLADSSNPGNTDRGLTAANFQNIEKAQFAFVFFNGAANRGYLDDISLTGDVIPEPSVALLSALGVLALLRRRR